MALVRDCLAGGSLEAVLSSGSRLGGVWATGVAPARGAYDDGTLGAGAGVPWPAAGAIGSVAAVSGSTSMMSGS